MLVTVRPRKRDQETCNEMLLNQIVIARYDMWQWLGFVLHLAGVTPRGQDRRQQARTTDRAGMLRPELARK